MNEELLEELCYKCYSISRNNKENMEAYAESMSITIQKFLKYTFQYIEKNINKPDYVYQIDKILSYKDSDKIIDYLKKEKINHNYLKNNLLTFFLEYRPNVYYLHPEEYDEIKNILIKYDNHLYRELDPLKTSVKIDDNYASNIIKSFINSPYSVNRFCFNNKIYSAVFKSFLQKCKKNNPELYNEYLVNVELKNKIQKGTILNDLEIIINEIKEKQENFTLIDFCLLTNFEALEIVKAADNVLNFEDNKLLRSKLKSIRIIDHLTNERLNKLINTDYTLNINNELINIKDEDKMYVVNFLQEHNIPICNDTFIDGCKKLYTNNLETKKRIK